MLCTISPMEPNVDEMVAPEVEMVALLRALTRHGLREGDWVCSLRTRITGQLAVERGAGQPWVVVQTDLGGLRAAISADTDAPHGVVVQAMLAARRAGAEHILVAVHRE